MKFCGHCQYRIGTDNPSFKIVGDYCVFLCPACESPCKVEPLVETARAMPPPITLSVDQCTYTIHCLQKQEAKLSNALKQVYDTITQLEILREIAKEQEHHEGRV